MRSHDDEQSRQPECASPSSQPLLKRLGQFEERMDEMQALCAGMAAIIETTRQEAAQAREEVRQLHAQVDDMQGELEAQEAALVHAQRQAMQANRRAGANRERIETLDDRVRDACELLDETIARLSADVAEQTQAQAEQVARMEVISADWVTHIRLLEPEVNALACHQALAESPRLKKFYVSLTLALQGLSEYSNYVKLGLCEVPDNFANAKEYVQIGAETAAAIAGERLALTLPVVGAVITSVVQATWQLIQGYSQALKITSFAKVTEMMSGASEPNIFIKRLAFDLAMMLEECITMMQDDHGSRDLLVQYICRAVMTEAIKSVLYPVTDRNYDGLTEDTIRTDLIARIMALPDTHNELSPLAKENAVQRELPGSTRVRQRRRTLSGKLFRKPRKEKLKPVAELGHYNTFATDLDGNRQVKKYFLERNEQSRLFYSLYYLQNRRLAQNANLSDHEVRCALLDHSGRLTEEAIADCEHKISAAFYEPYSRLPYTIRPFNYGGPGYFGTRATRGEEARILRVFRRWVKAYIHQRKLLNTDNPEAMKLPAIRYSAYNLFKRSGFKVWDAAVGGYRFYVRPPRANATPGELERTGSKPSKYGFIEISDAMRIRLQESSQALLQARLDAGDSCTIEPRFLPLILWQEVDPQASPGRGAAMIDGQPHFTPFGPAPAQVVGQADGLQPRTSSIAERLSCAGLWRPGAPMTHQACAEQSRIAAEQLRVSFAP